MTQVITVGQQKGGAGKTTIAAHLAVSLMQTGCKIAVIDIDPQGSLLAWHTIRAERFGEGYTGLTFISSSGWRVDNAISKLRNEFDYVIIDAPPHTETETKSAIRASHLVIVPMQATPTDLWATSSTMDFAASEEKRAIILLNRYNPNSNLAKEVISRIDYPKFNTTIGNRVAFSSCFLNGITVLESQPKSVAAKEVKTFTNELISLLEGNAKKGSSNMAAIEDA